MSTTKPAKVVFGTASAGDTLTGDDLKKTLDLFRKHGHVELDTAATYPINNFGASERALAQQDLSWARLSTKISALGAGGCDGRGLPGWEVQALWHQQLCASADRRAHGDCGEER
jgi:hypothetical protein